jgi:hypothetical protein
MPAARFRKGDRVKFRWGIYSVQGEVKEDRGPIGVKGRRLYLVEFRPGPRSEAPFQIELPAEELQSVRDIASME